MVGPHVASSHNDFTRLPQSLSGSGSWISRRISSICYGIKKVQSVQQGYIRFMSTRRVIHWLFVTSVDPI